MAMGRQGDRQGDLIVTWSEMPRSRATCSTTACSKCWLEPGSTASWRTPAERITPRPWARPRCHPAATFGCTWSGPSRGSTASAGSSGAVRSLGERLVFTCPAPDPRWRRLRGQDHGSRRPQRHTSSDRLQHALGPWSRLNKHFVNGLQRDAKSVTSRCHAGVYCNVTAPWKEASSAQAAQTAVSTICNTSMIGERCSYPQLDRSA